MKKIVIIDGVRPTYTGGTDITPVIRKRYDKNGNPYFEKIGEINVQEDINSYRNGCSLSAILERCKFMPLADKIQYLVQRPDVTGGDMVDLPKDLTEAFILIKKSKENNPEVFKRVVNGESLETVFKDLFNTKDKEIDTNGTDKSSD